MYLSSGLAELGPFQLISDGSDIPVFAFTTNEKANFSVFDVSNKLRERGWLVPAYTFPKNREDLAVLRCVCKEGFTRDMADMLLRDMQNAIDYFASRPNHSPQIKGTGFHH